MPDVGEVRYKAQVDTSGLDGQINEVEEELKRKGQGVGESLGEGISDGVEKSTDGIGDALCDSVKKGGTKAQNEGKGIGDKLGALVKSEFASQAAELSATLANVGQDLIKTGLQYNMTLESYQMNFTTLLGSAAEAQNLVDQLSAMARKTPFNTNDLADAAQMLLTVGYSADEIMPTLEMLGDVSLGDTEKMSRMAIAMSQISSAGKLNAEDLNQLIDAGFNPLLEISEMTGKSMNELKEEMADGAISADMVTEAFEHATSEGGKFYNAINNAGDTTAGKLANLQESIEGLLGKLTEGLIPAIQPIVDLLADIVGWLTEHETVAAALGAVLVTLTVAFTGLSAVLSIVTPLLLAFGAGFTAALGPIAAVIAIIAVVAAAIAALAVNFDDIKAAVTQWASDVSAKISEWAANTAQAFSEWWANTKQGFSDFCENTKQRLSDWWSNTKQGFTDWWNTTKAGLLDWVEATGDKIATWASDSKRTLSEWWSNTKQGFSDWWTNIKQGFLDWGANLWDSVKQTAQNLWDAFVNIDWKSVGTNIINGIIQGIQNGVSNLINSAVNAASRAFNSVKRFLGINSPSKKFSWIGEMSGEGFEEGFSRSMQTASKGAENIMADTVDSVAAAGDTAMNLSKTINFSGRFGNETRIEVPLYLDGREVARASAWYMGEQLSWEER